MVKKIILWVVLTGMILWTGLCVNYVGANGQDGSHIHTGADCSWCLGPGYVDSVATYKADVWMERHKEIYHGEGQVPCPACCDAPGGCQVPCDCDDTPPNPGGPCHYDGESWHYVNDAQCVEFIGTGTLAARFARKVRHLGDGVYEIDQVNDSSQFIEDRTLWLSGAVEWEFKGTTGLYEVGGGGKHAFEWVSAPAARSVGAMRDLAKENHLRVEWANLGDTDRIIFHTWWGGDENRAAQALKGTGPTLSDLSLQTEAMLKGREHTLSAVPIKKQSMVESAVYGSRHVGSMNLGLRENQWYRGRCDWWQDVGRGTVRIKITVDGTVRYDATTGGMREGLEPIGRHFQPFGHFETESREGVMHLKNIRYVSH